MPEPLGPTSAHTWPALTSKLRPLHASTPAADGFFRIGHMGHVNAHMVLGALGAIEAGLAALDIPHGSGGVSAAARALAAD